jgi:hypothetical protein
MFAASLGTSHRRDRPVTTESIAKSLVLALLALALAGMVSVVAANEAHAQDMSAELAQFESECFTDGEFDKTDGCIEWAEEAGIEIETTSWRAKVRVAPLTTCTRTTHVRGLVPLLPLAHLQ